jgi:hypothetical protein
VLAARMEHGHDHQIGVAEQPLLGAGGSFGHTGQLAEVLVPRQAAQVIAADARQAGDFFLASRLLRCFQ